MTSTAYRKPYDPSCRYHSPIVGDPRHVKVSNIAGDITRAYLDFMHAYTWQVHNYQYQQEGSAILASLNHAALDIIDQLKQAAKLAPTPETCKSNTDTDARNTETATA